MKLNMVSHENIFEKIKIMPDSSVWINMRRIFLFSYLDENISHLPSLSRLLLFRVKNDFKMFDKYVPKKIYSRKLHVFFYLPIFLSIFMKTVCAFPRYFTLTVFRFSWLLVDYYEYLPSDFMDCFAMTST